MRAMRKARDIIACSRQTADVTKTVIATDRLAELSEDRCAFAVRFDADPAVSMAAICSKFTKKLLVLDTDRVLCFCL
jgi:hypothetical protein